MPLVILSGASGVGKSKYHVTLEQLGFIRQVSATTRALRPGEIDGVHYRSLCQSELIRRAIDGDFIEITGVHHGDLYATFREPIITALVEGHRVFVEIDVVGRERLLANLASWMRDETHSVFIKAPSMAELERRLRERNDMSEEKMKQRLAKAELEESFASKYDLAFVNDDLEKKRLFLRDRIDERFGPWIGSARSSQKVA